MKVEMSQRGIETAAAVEVIKGSSPKRETKGTAVSLVQTCSSCGRTMTIGGGDVLFGDKWFHGLCWSVEGKA